MVAEESMNAANDIRFAIRRLRKDAGTTIAAVAALAFAIGAAAATWSLLSAVLLKPLPVAAPERLFQVDWPVPAFDRGTAPSHSYPIFESIRDSGAFDGIAAGGPSINRVLVTEQGVVPQGRQIYFANRDFFATLGIEAALGRTFVEDEDRRGAPVVAVLSDRYWRSAFNADPNALGRSMTVGGAFATIVGVLPRGFRGLHLSEAPDFYVPLHAVGDIDQGLPPGLDPFGRGFGWMRIVGRLRPGETAATATSRINALDCMCGRELTHGEVQPLSLTNVSIAAVPGFARAGTAQFTTLLSITVALLLLVGCLTVGMLLLVRTEDRRDELAVRLALGATRSWLARSIAIEAAILCTLGAMLAVPVALWLSYGVRTFQLPGRIDIERLELTLGPEAWLAVTSIALATTIVIALLASLTGVAVSSPLQARALSIPRVTRRGPRAIVAGQVAITLVLVTGAGLFTRSLIEALSLNPGVETDRIATGYLSLGRYGYTPERGAAFVEELLERLRRNGAIESVSIMQSLSSTAAGVPLHVDGLPIELPSGVRYLAVDDTYFSTVGLPIVSGREFVRSDAAGGSVAVLSESLARLIADGGDALGHQIADASSFRRIARGEAAVNLEVVGVVPDLIINVNTTEPLVVYQPVVQRPTLGVEFAVRAAGDAGAAIRETIAAVRAQDPRVTVEALMTVDEQLARQMNPQRFGIYVLSGLGGIALLLTVLGTYVTAESLVVRRRRELGIRAALGARSAQLRRLVLRDTARLVGIGLIAGLALAVAGARLIRSLLYQVEPLDPIVLVAAAALIFSLALLVSLRPGLAATRVDLTRSLREE
jgi:putative ABC transport system permease protein